MNGKDMCFPVLGVAREAEHGGGRVSCLRHWRVVEDRCTSRSVLQCVHGTSHGSVYALDRYGARESKGDASDLSVPCD